MTGWWINEWRRGRYPMIDLSIVNITVSRHDLTVVLFGFGGVVSW